MPQLSELKDPDLKEGLKTEKNVKSLSELHCKNSFKHFSNFLSFICNI